jgi:hypothetical protein
MGLDMYLSKKTYVKQWDHQSPEEKHEVTVTKGGNRLESIKSNRVKYVEEEVGYWRKANQIHRWFVENVQDGDDNCRSYYVDESKLEELLELCKKVLENPELGPELLPTQSGFFYGSVEYGEWYIEDLKNTITIIEELFSERNESGYLNGDIYYTSSW